MTEHQTGVMAADIAAAVQRNRAEGTISRVSIDSLLARRSTLTALEAAEVAAWARWLVPLVPGVRVRVESDRWSPPIGEPMTVERIDVDGWVVCAHDHPSPQPAGWIERLRYHATELRVLRSDGTSIPSMCL